MYLMIQVDVMFRAKQTNLILVIKRPQKITKSKIFLSIVSQCIKIYVHIEEMAAMAV